MAIQATKWTAQLIDGTKMYGGQEGGLCPYPQSRVNEIPLDLLKAFTITHNTFAHMYYAPLNRWYINGVWNPNYAYPAEYIMQDGSTVTVDYNNGIVLTQVYPE